MTSIEVDTIKQHEKTAIAANKKDLLFYFYLLALIEKNDHFLILYCYYFRQYLVL